MEKTDILIVGGGAAGIAAAAAVEKAGVLLVDRRPRLGGVLPQCTHRGFGSGLTGGEYARDLLRGLSPRVKLALNTTVLSIRPDRTALLCGRDWGREEVRFSQLILAAGCREIPLGALSIGGTRPRGVYTAGQMQEMMNLYGFVPAGPVVILGSGDLGLIMADRMARAGLPVTLVEKKPQCGGMARNRHCLALGNVRLICGATLDAIQGSPSLQSVVTSSGETLPCRTLLIAAGLRPERELAAELGDPSWLTLCGNCREVHPMVEAVVKEGTLAGRRAEEGLKK